MLAATPAAAMGAVPRAVGEVAERRGRGRGASADTQSTAHDRRLNRDGRAQDVAGSPAYKAPAGEYLNTGGHFRRSISDLRAGRPPRLRGRRREHDGRQDIYCAVGASHGVKIKSNELWMQQPNGGFVNEAAKYHVVDPYGRSRGAVFFDANKDGWPDLFVSNYYPRPDGLPTPNRFYLSDHGRGFVSAPGYGLNRTVGGLALAPGCQQSGDYNGDGFPDLLVCGKAGIHLYRNNGGKSFTDVTVAVGLSGVWYGARMVDLNRDGRLELVMVNRGGCRCGSSSRRRFGVVRSQRG